jgi:arabinosyltransferase B
VVLRSARNRMAFTAAVLFVIALTFSSTNGWWYVSSYGVPFNNALPKIGGVTVSSIFFALFGIAALWAFWLHLARDRTESKVVRLVTAAPIPVTAGLMVVVFVGSMLVGVVRQYPTYSNASSNLKALT